MLDLIRRNEDFHDIIFSDETTFQTHTYHHYGLKEIEAMNSHIPKLKHPQKLHTWTGISRRGATNLMIFQDIMDAEFYVSILEDALVPFIRETFPDGHRFQQDNDPKHTSLKAGNFMDRNNIVYPKWPAQSPDLNLIEMVWAQMKSIVDRSRPMTKEQLADCMEEVWSSTMTTEQCNMYIDHSYKVVPVCVLINGLSTSDVPNSLS